MVRIFNEKITFLWKPLKQGPGLKHMSLGDFPKEAIQN